MLRTSRVAAALALLAAGSVFYAGSAQAGTVILSDLTVAGGTATAFPTDTPVNEAPNFAFDDIRTTKGLIFNDAANDDAGPYEDVTANNPVIWTWAFAGGTQQIVRGYSLTSANDAKERDPRDFFLEGSNNGTNWTPVDTVTGHDFLDQAIGDQSLPSPVTDQTRFETYFFAVDTPASYSQYRLRLIETFGTTNDRPQIAEIQFFDQAIPEPTAVGILAVVGAGLMRRGRRR